MTNRYLIICITALTSICHAQDVCSTIEGANIVADDGTFLGRIENEYSAKSVLNSYGTHGSEYSSTSIWNENGNYGGKFSKQSPFNPYTNSPPMIIKGGEVIGYLSANKNIRYALNPYVLKTCDF